MADALRGVDANVILRYLLRDIPDQAERARRLIESETPIGISAVALAEVAWTLTGPRKLRPRQVVAAELLEFLARENVVTIGFDKADGSTALVNCGRPVSPPNFGDALIAACSRSFGIEEIYSFDQRFVRAGLTPIAPA